MGQDTGESGTEARQSASANEPVVYAFPPPGCEPHPGPPPTHLGALLAAVSIPFIPYSLWRLLSQPTENDTLTMGGFVFFAALVTGAVERMMQSDRIALVEKVAGKRERPAGDRPFQFGLSDLLGSVFLLALVTGIWSTSQERDMPGTAWRVMFELTWDLLYGCLLAVSTVLLVAGWRRKDAFGLALSIPILLGTVVHFVWRGAADDAVFLVWSSYAVIFGLVLHVRWRRWLGRFVFRRRPVRNAT